jgi:hypothetical protein
MFSFPGGFLERDKFGSGFQEKEEVGEFRLVVAEREVLLILELIGLVLTHITNINVRMVKGIGFTGF